jgi:transposase
MFSLNDSNRYFLYPHPTDMRKSFYSLSGIVKNEMGKDIQDGDVFIFINRSLSSLKILHLEYGGLVIYHMKLERGCLHLPEFDMDEERTELGMNWAELMLMVQGIDPKKVKRSPRWIAENKAQRNVQKQVKKSDNH